MPETEEIPERYEHAWIRSIIVSDLEQAFAVMV
jgi:hypothetical protein